jgi:predicted TIM-barrel fold metal-dependent hydrolase
MFIVDSQVHTWTAGTPPYVHLQRPFSNEDLIAQMDAAGVSRAVLVPPNWDPDGLAYAERGALAHPGRLAVMGNIAIDDPGGRSALSTWTKDGRIGLRLTFATPERVAALSDGTTDWLWAAAQDMEISIMLAVWGQLRAAIPIASRYPGLRLIIDHLGIPVTHRTMDDAAFSDMDAVLALSRHPNVAVKASGLPAHSTEAYPYRNLHDHLHRIVDAFGPRRTFWGTDFTRMPCSYQECITLFTQELPWLSDDDMRQIMGQAICDWIGWPVSPAETVASQAPQPSR